MSENIGLQDFFKGQSIDYLARGVSELKFSHQQATYYLRYKTRFEEMGASSAYDVLTHFGVNLHDINEQSHAYMRLQRELE